MYCLLEVVSVYPEKLATRFIDKMDWIKVSLKPYFLGVFLGGGWNLALAKSGIFLMVKQNIISKYALDLKSGISTHSQHLMKCCMCQDGENYFLVLLNYCFCSFTYMF